MLAMWDDLFDTDLESDVQATLADVTSEGFADVAMNGVVNKVTGVDIASRLRLGGVAGINDYDGFNPGGLFHAGGSFISALYNAPAQIARGDFEQIDVVPPGLKKAHTALAEDGKVYSKSGELVMDLEGYERFIYGVGFRPTALSAKQNQISMLKNIEQVASRENVRQRVDMSEEVLRGDFTRVEPIVRELIEPEIQQMREAGLDSTSIRRREESLYRKEVLKYIDTALGRVFESDPFESGSAATAQKRAQLQESFGKLRTPRALTLERERMKMELMSAATGKPVDRRTKTLRMFEMIDSIILENPSLTRGQARAIAQQKLSSSARSGLTLERDFR